MLLFRVQWTNQPVTWQEPQQDPYLQIILPELATLNNGFL
jgi:hypothetical protein